MNSLWHLAVELGTVRFSWTWSLTKKKKSFSYCLSLELDLYCTGSFFFLLPKAVPNLDLYFIPFNRAEVITTQTLTKSGKNKGNILLLSGLECLLRRGMHRYTALPRGSRKQCAGSEGLLEWWQLASETTGCRDSKMPFSVHGASGILLLNESLVFELCHKLWGSLYDKDTQRVFVQLVCVAPGLGGGLHGNLSVVFCAFHFIFKCK